MRLLSLVLMKLKLMSMFRIEASYSKAAREEQCRILEAFGVKAILGYMA